MILYSPSTFGFYSPEYPSNIPGDALEITTEHHIFLLEAQSSGKVITPNAEGYPEAVDPPSTPTEELVARALKRINKAFEVEAKAATADYPQSEIDSWTKQEAEARAWFVDNNAPTPWIDAAVDARGVSKIYLVTKIMANADAFTVASGQLSGKRQKLRDQILALENPTSEQLNAIQW